MAVTRCRSCGETLIDGHNVLSGIFGKPRPHECPPSWECRMQSERPDESEWEMHHGHDAQTAAQKFAEEYDCNCGDYPILAGGQHIVEVRREGQTDVERFSVYGESVPHYYANATS